MNSRRHGRKPTLALWMLVAVADVALIVTAIGMVTTLVVLATLALLAGAVVAGRMLVTRQAEPALVTRRAEPALVARRVEPVPQVVARRRS